MDSSGKDQSNRISRLEKDNYELMAYSSNLENKLFHGSPKFNRTQSESIIDDNMNTLTIGNESTIRNDET